jgi:hypothetical protein
MKLESMLDAIVMQYEQATPDERAAMSPFCKFFYEMAQTQKPLHDDNEASV